MKGYAICTERRSGSVLLCRLLASTGVLGRPTEYFDANTVRNGRGIADYPTDPEAQIGLIPTVGASANGVYGLKLFGAHVDAIKPIRWAGRLPSLSFVYLERHDILGQAISQVRALQTQQWTSSLPAVAEPVYDRERIDKTLVRPLNARARWRYFFVRNGLTVLNLVYEDIVRFPQQTAESVARLIGLDETPKVDLNQIGDLKVQRDALSQQWRARFIAESRDLGAFH